jgi:hypothetical protein
MAQHVTFFRMKALPGKVDELTAMMSSMDDESQARERGWVGDVVGRRKDDPDEIWGCVTWDTSERYYANADSPEQNAEYEKMRALLASDPEWFDCDVLEERMG